MTDIINSTDIKDKIFTIRGEQVMIDEDLALLYGVEVKRLNEQVKRNIKRFPDIFRFQLTKEEFENLKSQSATSSWGGRRKLPYVFTEQGVAMLSAVLHSDTAIKVSVQIMQAFVEMKRFIASNVTVFQRLDRVEQKQIESDHRFEQIFKAIEDKSITPNQGVFFDGQIFDAYTLVADIVRKAKKSIVLVDNYVDDSVLTLFSKKSEGVNCAVFTKNISKQLSLDANKFNKQYGDLILYKFDKAHDRFLIIDGQEVYHIGASLKDLGKKWFAFSKMDKESLKIMNNLRLIMDNKVSL
jgi:hypothetical protein